MSTVYIGIDPGKSESGPGAIAGVYPGGHVTLMDIVPDDMENVANLTSLVRQAALEGHGVCVVIERVSAGGTANAQGRQMGASSAFNFGYGAGVLFGAVMAHGIVPLLVTPAVWRAVMTPNAKGLSREEKKGESLRVARDLFPTMIEALRFKKNNGRAEAMLLAEYGRAKGKG